MQLVVTDGVVWSVGRSVRLSVTIISMIISPSKTVELIEMPFRLWTQVGPRNHILDGGPDPPMGRASFEGEKGWPIVKYRDYHPCAVVMWPFCQITLTTYISFTVVSSVRIYCTSIIVF